MTAKEIAEKGQVPLWKVYYIANRLGYTKDRLPTVEEIANYIATQKKGRPSLRKNTEG